MQISNDFPTCYTKCKSKCVSSNCLYVNIGKRLPQDDIQESPRQGCKPYVMTSNPYCNLLSHFGGCFFFLSILLAFIDRTAEDTTYILQTESTAGQRKHANKDVNNAGFKMCF